MIRGGRDEDEDRPGLGVWQAEAGPMQVRLRAGGWLVGRRDGRLGQGRAGGRVRGDMQGARHLQGSGVAAVASPEVVGPGFVE